MGSKQIQELDIVSLSSADSLVIQNSTGSYKQVIGSDITTPLSSLAARVTVLESATMGILYETAANYIILDTDNYGYIWVDARTGDKTITLPTLAANQGREILVGASYHGGAVIVAGEGAETIDGHATFKICNQYGFIKVKAIAGGWVSISQQSIFRTGYINRSDWTDVTLGTIMCNYTGSTGTFIVGEAMYESSAAASTTTGKGGIIAAASTSWVKLRDVTGGGSFTNAYFIHGVTSSAGAALTSATKNVDTTLYHGMDRDFIYLKFQEYYSSVSTGSVGYCGLVSYGQYGNMLAQVDTNTLSIQTGATGGFMNYDTLGNLIYWDAEDFWYNFQIHLEK